MRKKLSILLVVALSAIGVMAISGGSTALAQCSDGTSQARDAEGNTTGADTLATAPGTGTVIYGDGAESQLNPGYLGATGSTGYIEISGNADDAPNVQVDGRESGGNLDGRVSADSGDSADPVDVCVNGNEPV